MAKEGTYSPYELGNGYHPGRPSEYKPEYCEVARTYLARHSMVAFTGVVKATKKTIQEWRKTYPEFDAACCEGEAKRAEMIEDILHDQSTTNNKKSAAAAIFLAKNWSDLVDKQTRMLGVDDDVTEINVTIRGREDRTESEDSDEARSGND